MIAPQDAKATDSRPAVLSTVLILLVLPLLVATVEAVKFHGQNRDTGHITSSGDSRGYVLHVPPSYDRTKPAPLVISIHGAGLWGAAHEAISEWDRVADREGIIVAYPSAANEEGPDVWHVDRSTGLSRDVKFISDLIDTISSTYNIDSTRIYANGLSNGGGMSFVLSCALSNRIAAVGLVSAALTLPAAWCINAQAVPMIMFQGTSDPEIPYEGGKVWLAPRAFPNVPRFVATWARRNRCAGTSADSVVASDVTRHVYSDCANGADVVLYTIERGGHTWPGGGYLPESWLGRTTRSIDASSVMWAFFNAHPLSHPTR